MRCQIFLDNLHHSVLPAFQACPDMVSETSYLRPMREISFKTTFGDQVKTVRITQPFGMAGVCQLLIDHYYQGQFVKYRDVWEWRPQDENKDPLTPEDVAALIQRIEETLSSAADDD